MVRGGMSTQAMVVTMRMVTNMDMYTVYDILGDCECCAGKKVIGMFTTFGAANGFVRRYAKETYGRVISFTQKNEVIDSYHDYEGYLAFEISMKKLTDPDFQEQEFERVVTWLHDEPNIDRAFDNIVTTVVQHFEDTVGLRFSGYIITLTKDGHWFIEANDGG